MVIIRIILVAILIYYGLRLLGRLLLPMLLKNLMNTMENKVFTNAHQEDTTTYKRPKGEVTIDYAPTKSKKIQKEEGEYIDYEEIK